MKNAFLAFVTLGCAIALPNAAAANGPEQTVRRLYHDYAWEAVMTAQAGTSLADQPQQVLRRYFTPRLASAIRSDSQCAAQNHDICALDFSPIWDSQDPGAYDLTVSSLADSRVLVQFKTPQGDKASRLEYRLVRLQSGWRISDIVYPEGGSLRSLLGVAQ
jgi:hypothetical protein